MAHDHDYASATLCHSCDCQPFLRNAYWTGKLMLARDFTDEQRYVVEKLRHHNQHLHGTGVVCGLKVVPHDKVECRKYFVCVDPGTAVDCCGHDIVLCERECIDLRSIPEIKKLFDDGDTKSRALRVCIRFRECPTEDIPVLYDECGCDDARCAPNRILESYEVVVELLDKLPDPPKPTFPPDCCDLWNGLECHDCDRPDCVVLATIPDFVAGVPIVDTKPASGTAAVIDNLTFRQILPSLQAIKEFLDCLKLCEPGKGGGKGEKGEKGDAGVVGVDLKMIPCGTPESATIIVDGAGNPVLTLRIPSDCGQAPLVVDMEMVDCGTAKVATVSVDALGNQTLTLRIPSDCNSKPVALAHICSINWSHGQDTKASAIASGLVIAFDQKITAANLHSQSIRIFRDQAKSEDDPNDHCWCQVPGDVQAGDVKPPCDAVSGTFTKSGAANVTAARFVPSKKVGWRAGTYRVVVIGDLIADSTKEGRAVDGNHLPPWLPKRPTGDGVEGGTFESWFVVG